MKNYQTPLDDMQFVLFDVFQAEQRWAEMPAYQGQLDRPTAAAMLEEAARLTQEQIAPLNRVGDEEGARWDNGRVTTPTGFREAYQCFSEGGWAGLTGNPEFGGMGMPKSLAVLVDEMLFAANSGFALYPALSAGACLAIDAHATPALKQRYLPQLYAGTWAGSMCLTEPHSGSDLGLIRTRAEPLNDGTFAITGTKIFITGGEQDLTDNIVHLVLAKLPGAPEGSRGISLFLVPKVWVNDDGSLAGANGVTCGSIEHKMGIKGSATCVMNFENARGYLIGQENRGLQCMFTMMNCERLSIGIQGISCADMSYQTAATYAKERLQGRDATGSNDSKSGRAADPILVHPDVRRMLLDMRATTEAGRALAVYLGMQIDLAKHGATPEVRANADALVALLIPVAKAFFTDLGLQSTVQGQQVLGGHGYVREWGQEQLVRDVRIAQIYEGTNGIQALDLLQRKIFATRGESLGLLLNGMREWMHGTAAPALSAHVATQLRYIDALDALTQRLLAKGETSQLELGAAACDYLHIVGYVTYGYLWLRMMHTALLKGDAHGATKQKTGAYYFHRILPRVDSLIATIDAGADDMMGFTFEEF